MSRGEEEQMDGKLKRADGREREGRDILKNSINQSLPYSVRAPGCSMDALLERTISPPILLLLFKYSRIILS